MSSAADRNLLFGILALQMDFVSREQLIAAVSAWVLEKGTPLGALLVRQQALADDRRALLEALVTEHLKQHGNDPEKSLAAVSSIASVREQLQRIADPQIDASLAHVSQEQSATKPDPEATRSVGESTSDGLRFRILRPHAKGGLGEVFVAEDEELRREVALKQIQPHRADDPNSRSRFVLEAEITGGLEHPGIVPVYGLGTYADGRPFYAMRFIRGDSLKDAIERFHSSAAAKLTPGERTLQFRKLLGRFIDVCNAIDYAHSRGVLHRDLKPGNIMLGKYGETLVVDWGLAKAIGRTEPSDAAAERPMQPTSGSGSAPTQMGSAIGTPQYMSPEQAAGRLDLLGPASDVYSLGATLYCLLTGQAPLADQQIDDTGELLRRVQWGEFTPPRQLKSQISDSRSQISNFKSAIPKPLEAICLKAMALKPADRYPSPRLLADDLEHWLADEPIEATPDTFIARAARVARRHRAWVQAGAASLVLITIASIIAIVVINGAKDDAILAERKAVNLADDKTKLATANLELANKEAGERAKVEKQTASLARGLFELGAAELSHGDPNKGMAILAKAYDSAADGDLVRESARTLLGVSVDSFPICLPLHKGTIVSGPLPLVEFSPDGASVLSTDNNMARLWDATTGRPLGEQMMHDGQVSAVAFSPDGSTVVTGVDGRGKSVLFSRVISSDRGKPKTARLWDARTGRSIGEPMTHDEGIATVAFSPDGKSILTDSDDGKARLWDARTGKPIGAPITYHGRGLSVFSPDGTIALTGSDDGRAQFWDPRTGKPRGDPMQHDGPVSHVVFSPNGATILTGCRLKNMTSVVQLWDARTATRLGQPMKLDGFVTHVVYGPDGATLMTGWLLAGSNERSITSSARLWNAQSGEPIAGEPMKFNGQLICMAFSPDGTTVETTSFDGFHGTTQLWDARNGKPLNEPISSDETIFALTYGPDGATTMKILYSGDFAYAAKIYDNRIGKPLGEPMNHDEKITGMAFAPDGATLLTGSGNTTRFWDVRTGRPLGEPVKHDGFILAVAFSPRGAFALTGHAVSLLEKSGRQSVMSVPTSDARLTDARTGRPIGETIRLNRQISYAAFSPDGAMVVTACEDNTARLWDAQTGKPLSEAMKHDGGISAVACSPDGATVLTGSYDKMARLWDARTGKLIGNPIKFDGVVRPVAYSPDGATTLAMGDHTARFWNTLTGKMIGEPIYDSGADTHVAFSPDGAMVIIGGPKGARFWDVQTGKPLGEWMKHGDPLQCVAFSPDGATVSTGSAKTGRLWAAALPLPKRLIPMIVAIHSGVMMNDQGKIQALSENELLENWKALENDGAAWLAQQRKSDQKRNVGWHHYEAAEAESTGNWFAADFHLKWLVAHDPADADLAARRDRAHANCLKSRASPLAFVRWNYAADASGIAGFYKMNGDASWVVTKGDKLGATFQETSRTAEYVELFDAKRSIWIRLTPTEATFSSDQKTWHKLFNGTPAADPPAASPPASPTVPAQSPPAEKPAGK